MSKIVLITGASSGMGKVTAELLANEGYIVYAGVRDENISFNIKNIQIVYLDVTKTESRKL